MQGDREAGPGSGKQKLRVGFDPRFEQGLPADEVVEKRPPAPTDAVLDDLALAVALPVAGIAFGAAESEQFPPGTDSAAVVSDASANNVSPLTAPTTGTSAPRGAGKGPKGQTYPLVISSVCRSVDVAISQIPAGCLDPMVRKKLTTTWNAVIRGLGALLKEMEADRGAAAVAQSPIFSSVRSPTDGALARFLYPDVLPGLVGLVPKPPSLRDAFAIIRTHLDLVRDEVAQSVSANALLAGLDYSPKTGRFDRTLIGDLGIDPALPTKLLFDTAVVPKAQREKIDAALLALRNVYSSIDADAGRSKQLESILTVDNLKRGLWNQEWRVLFLPLQWVESQFIESRQKSEDTRIDAASRDLYLAVTGQAKTKKLAASAFQTDPVQLATSKLSQTVPQALWAHCEGDRATDLASLEKALARFEEIRFAVRVLFHADRAAAPSMDKLGFMIEREERRRKNLLTKLPVPDATLLAADPKGVRAKIRAETREALDCCLREACLRLLASERYFPTAVVDARRTLITDFGFRTVPVPEPTPALFAGILGSMDKFLVEGVGPSVARALVGEVKTVIGRALNVPGAVAGGSSTIRTHVDVGFYAQTPIGLTDIPLSDEARALFPEELEVFIRGGTVNSLVGNPMRTLFFKAEDSAEGRNRQVMFAKRWAGIVSKCLSNSESGGTRFRYVVDNVGEVGSDGPTLTTSAFRGREIWLEEAASNAGNMEAE